MNSFLRDPNSPPHHWKRVPGDWGRWKCEKCESLYPGSQNPHPDPNADTPDPYMKSWCGGKFLSCDEIVVWAVQEE